MRRHLYAVVATIPLMFTAFPAKAQVSLVNGVFCNTASQMESLAEAHVGAGLAVPDALREINEAVKTEHACSAMENIIVDHTEDVKEVEIAGHHLVIRRVRVVGLLHGMLAQPILPKAQFVLVSKKAEGRSI